MYSDLIPSYIAVPKEAQYLVPEPKLIFSGKGKSIQRFLFTGQVFSEFEDEKLKRLEMELQKSKIDPYRLHPNWTRNDLLRFCYGTGWKTRVAKEVICKYLNWFETTMPNGYLMLYPRVSELFKSGCLYVHGRDIYFRPIIVINFNRFDFKKVDIQEYVYLIAFFLEYVIENMLLPGKVENWVVITDFEKSGLSDLGFGSVKKVMNLLTDYYRCRLGNNYVVNPSKTVYYMWKCLGPFLDEVVIEKVKILNKSTPDEIFIHCNRYQVEEKYGGKAKNVENYWPPTMPCAPYDLNGEIKENISEGPIRIQELKEPSIEEIKSNKSSEVDEPNEANKSFEGNEDIEFIIQPLNTKNPLNEVQIDSEENEKSLKKSKKSKKKQKRAKKEKSERKNSQKKPKKSSKTQENPIESIEELNIQEKYIDNCELQKSIDDENEVQVAFSELLENNKESSGILQEGNASDQNCGICSVMLSKEYNKCHVF